MWCIYTPYNGALNQQSRSTPEIQVQRYYSPISRLRIIKNETKQNKQQQQQQKISLQKKPPKNKAKYT